MGILTLAEKLIVAYTSMALVFSVGSANVAQLVEQRIRNAWVAGSSPAVGSIEFAGQSFTRLAFFVFLDPNSQLGKVRMQRQIPFPRSANRA